MANRHPITHVVRKQIEPLAQLAIIEQFGFEIQEIFDRVAQRRYPFMRARAGISFQLFACSILAQCMYRLS